MSKPRIKDTKFNNSNLGLGSMASNAHINRNSIYYDNKINGSVNFQRPTPNKNMDMKKKLLNPNETVVNDSMTSISVSTCGGTFGQEQIIPLSNKMSSNMNILTPQPIMNTLNQEEVNYEISQHLNLFSLLNRIIHNAIYKPDNSRLVHFLHNYIFLVVFCAVFTMCFETINSFRIYEYQKNIWKYLECFYTINLSLDWITRLVTYPYRAIESETNNKRRLKIKNSFLKKYAGFIDLTTIIDFLGTIPFYLELIFPEIAFQQLNENSWAILILRTFRIFRLFRLLYRSHSTTSKQLKLVFLAFRHSRNGLIMVLWVFLVLVVFFASLFFFAEIFQCELDIETQTWMLKNGKDNNELCSVQSIVDAFWWTVVTLSTVAYGDTTPLTPFGKVIGTITIIVTILIFFPIPSIIVSAHLTELIAEDQKEAAIKKIFERRNKKIQRHRINHDKNIFDRNNNKDKIKSTGSVYASNYSLSRQNESKSMFEMNRTNRLLSNPKAISNRTMNNNTILEEGSNVNISAQSKNEVNLSNNNDISRMTSLKDNIPYKSLLSLSLRNDIPSFPSHQSILTGKLDSSSSESSSSSSEDNDDSDDSFSNEMEKKKSTQKNKNDVNTPITNNSPPDENENLKISKLNEISKSFLALNSKPNKVSINSLNPNIDETQFTNKNLKPKSMLNANSQYDDAIHNSVMNSIFNIQNTNKENNNGSGILTSKEFNSDSIEQLMFEQENFEDPEFIKQMLIEFCMLCDEEIKNSEERLKSLEIVKNSYEKGVMALQQIHQKDYYQ